jgi:hypothetical protein
MVVKSILHFNFMKKITKLEINRQRWGTGNDGGKLLNPDNNKMCCLGFFCRQAGVKAGVIKGEGMPADLCDIAYGGGLVTKHQRAIFDTVVTSRNQNRKVTTQLATVNDSTAPKFVKNPLLRETRIKQLFGKLGVKVVFTGKQHDPATV